MRPQQKELQGVLGCPGIGGAIICNWLVEMSLWCSPRVWAERITGLWLLEQWSHWASLRGLMLGEGEGKEGSAPGCPGTAFTVPSWEKEFAGKNRAGKKASCPTTSLLDTSTVQQTRTGLRCGPATSQVGGLGQGASSRACFLIHKLR